MSDYQFALVDCLAKGEVRRAYFPADEGTKPSVPPGVLCQCAVALRAMDEPALTAATGEGGRVQYRFLWLRTGHRPVAVRVERAGVSGTLTVRVLDGKGGYDIGALQQADERCVEGDQWRRVEEWIAGSRFWKLPSVGGREGLDGAAWFLEGARSGEHKLVYRWSPEAGGEDEAFRAICLNLILLADLGDAAEPVY